MRNLTNLVLILFYLILELSCAQKIIAEGKGYGTMYYDVVSPKVQHYDWSVANSGALQCSFSTKISLDDVHSNYIIAINATELRQNRNKYCGKRVIVDVGGVTSDKQFFIGDGCKHCALDTKSGKYNPHGAPGLNFSYLALMELSCDAYAKGNIEIGWKIVDEEVHSFPVN